MSAFYFVVGVYALFGKSNGYGLVVLLRDKFPVKKGRTQASNASSSASDSDESSSGVASLSLLLFDSSSSCCE